MTVAVICNLSDGLIMGVDSAVSISDMDGVQKVFEDGDKLFQLAEKIGVATYGLGSLEGRTIGSFIHEFEITHTDIGKIPISEVVERLRMFFFEKYVAFAEHYFSTKFDEIPDDKKGPLSLIVGGFSPGEFLSEAWLITIPANRDANSAEKICDRGSFLVKWFAMSGPIDRYLTGFDRDFLSDTSDFFVSVLGRPFTDEELARYAPIRDKYMYRIFLDAMPIKAGIEYVRFLVQLVIQHYRYMSEHPIVGGQVKLGVVTYKGERFR